VLNPKFEDLGFVVHDRDVPLPVNSDFLHQGVYTSPFFVQLDASLQESWMELAAFSTRINFASSTGSKFPVKLQFEAMMGVMYRLLNLQFGKESIDESIRLSLLAFSTHIFMMWRSVNMEYVWLAREYRKSLMSIKNLEEVPSEIVMWLLMVGAVSILNEADYVWLKPWLTMHLQMCDVNSWAELEQILKAHLWVDVLQSSVGKRVYEYKIPARVT
jgi:hypothetical protein